MSTLLHASVFSDMWSWDDLAAGGWAPRGNDTYAEAVGTTREGTRTDPSMVDFTDAGDLRLRIRKDPNLPGHYLLGHISRPWPQVHGYFEARIRFGRPEGAHGAFWHQSGYGPGGAELDVVEWFGERRPTTSTVETQGVQQSVYVGDPDGGDPLGVQLRTWSAGVPTGADHDDAHHALSGSRGDNATWWERYHTYAAWWGPDGYRFYVDGVRVGPFMTAPAEGLTSPSATIPGSLVLSLLSNDWERPKLEAHLASGGTLGDFDMFVRWVRVWDGRP